MNKYDKKAAWETVEVVYWKKGVKCHEKMKHFFSTRPAFHFHETMPLMGVLLAYNPVYTDSEEMLPKDTVVLTCTTMWWKNVKRIAKWGLKHDPEVNID